MENLDINIEELKTFIREKKKLFIAFDFNEKKADPEIKLTRLHNGVWQRAEVFKTERFHTTDSNNNLNSYESIDELYNDGWEVEKVS